MNFITKLLSHALFKGSVVMFIGTTIVNAGNYLFHLLTGRMLGPVEYGTLSSVISSLYILGIIPVALGIVIVRFVSNAKGRGDEEEISALFYWLRVKLLILGLVISFLLMLIIPYWLSYLKLTDSRLLIISSLMMPITLLVVLLRSFFTGLLQFMSHNIAIITETILKIILVFIFINIGWSVFGAILGMLLAGLGSFLISLPILRLKKPKKVFGEYQKTKNIFMYSIPAVLMTLSMTSLFSSDIILVKHYFTSFEAGIYASLSVLGKIVFFAASSLISVMFPLVAQKHARGENYKQIMWITIILIGAVNGVLVVIYYYLPNLMINLLFGNKYITGAGMLYLFAVYMSLYSLVNVIMNYFLSIGKTKPVIFPVIAASMQILLIIIWHHSLRVVIMNSIITTFMLLVGLLLYYKYDKR